MSYLRILIFLLLVSANTLMAQHKVSGRVVDETGLTLPSATVSLKSVTDSTKLHHAFSDNDGTFAFPKITNGHYYLQTSYITYKTTRQKIEVNNKAPEFLTIQLLPSANELREVVVQGQKQSVRTKGGITKLNVEDSNLAQSQSAYDLLKSLPGVNISKDGDIRVKGKSGVTMMIDGEPVEMGANQLKSLLKSTPGSTLQTVEVMNNPPASMDAAGNAGVINFVFSKKMKQGLNGTLTSGVSRGKYWNTDHGLSLSYGTGKWNFNLLYAYDYEHSWQRDETHRITNIEGGKLQMDQLQKTPQKTKGNLVKLNIDRQLDSKNTISLNTSFNHVSDPTKGSSLTSFGNHIEPDSLLRQMTNLKGNLQNWDGLLRHKIKFSEKNSFTTSLQVVHMKYDATQHTDVENSLTPSLIKFRDQYPTAINRWMVKSDYLHDVTDASGNKIGKVEMGVKGSYSKLDHKQLSDYIFTNKWVRDHLKSNSLQYKEAVQAAYASIEMKVNNWTFKGGLRGEYTLVKGDSIKSKNVVKQNYFSLFPNATVSYNYNNLYAISLAYSRRIDRPDYDKLNPTTKMLDLYTFEKGNPRLKPQYSDNIELSQQFFSFVDLTAGYSFIKDPMYFSYITTPSLQSYYTTINSGKENQWHIALSAPIPGIDWWENYHSVYVYNSQFNAELGGIKHKDRATSVGLFSFNSFKLSHNFSLELVAWYEGGGLYSNFRYKPLAEVNIGVSKKMLDEKLNVGVSVSDVFHHGIFRGHTLAKGDEVFQINSKSDSRSVKLSVSWNFGSSPQSK